MYPNLREKRINKEKSHRGPDFWGEKGEVCMIEREKNFRERSHTFSLRFTKIGMWVFIRARDKVGPRIKSYTWVLKSWGFVKLHEV